MTHGNVRSAGYSGPHLCHMPIIPQLVNELAPRKSQEHVL